MRRFNFTRRKKIPRGAFAISIEDGPPRTFSASFDMRSLDLPPDAKLVFEAFGPGSSVVARFPCGTVGRPAPPSACDLSAIESGSVLFNFKVVATGQHEGRILASARNIRLVMGDGRGSLLPVNPTALGHLVWRVSYNGDTPWLDVNRNIPDIMARTESDPAFAALVFPSVLAEVLTRALIIDDRRDPEDTECWQGRWLAFAMQLHPDNTPPPSDEDKDCSDRLAWIEAVQAAFAEMMHCDAQYSSVELKS